MHNRDDWRRHADQRIDADAEAPTEHTAPTWSEDRMYAIAFDLDKAACERHYPGTDWRNAYGDIRRVLEAAGFWSQQGSVYYSNHKRVVVVFQTVMELQAKCPWFRMVVRDLRMLRIEENDDLLPILGQPQLPLNDPKPRRMTEASALKLN
jgi:virulence-associated protein VapD